MENTEHREKVLDLGIGRMNPYLLNDIGNKIFRIGADIRMESLQSTKIYHLENLTQLDAKNNLPFTEESFDRVQIFYPDRSLLESVCNEKTINGVGPLWPELKRILRKGGTVELFLDVYKGLLPLSTGRYNDKGRIRFIWEPQVKARRAAEKHGFDVKTNRLSEKEIGNLDNFISLAFASYAHQYLISANKTTV